MTPTSQSYRFESWNAANSQIKLLSGPNTDQISKCYPILGAPGHAWEKIKRLLYLPKQCPIIGVLFVISKDMSIVVKTGFT